MCSHSTHGVITDYVPGTISLAIFISLGAGVSSPQMKRWGYLGSSFCPLPHEVFGKITSHSYIFGFKKNMKFRGISWDIIGIYNIYIYVHAGFNGESDYRFRSNHFHVCSMWWLRVIIRGVLEWPLASYFHIGLLEWITMFYLINHICQVGFVPLKWNLIRVMFLSHTTFHDILQTMLGYTSCLVRMIDYITHYGELPSTNRRVWGMIGVKMLVNYSMNRWS